MQTEVNPYQASGHTKNVPIGRKQFRSAVLAPVGVVFFWVGVVLAILGLFITFYPGVDFYWFAIAGIMILSGFMVPTMSYQLPAVIIGGLCIIWALQGYQRGIEYEKRWRNHAVLRKISD